MKTDYKISIPTAAVSILFCLGSCTADTPEPDNSLPDDNSIRIAATVIPEEKVETRVTDDTKPAFEPGDAIGIYLVCYDRLSNDVFTPGTLELHGNQADNIQHVLNTIGGISVWQSEKPEVMCWNDAVTPIDLIAYSPYSKDITAGATHMQEVPFVVQADQSATNSTTKRTNYQQSDLMWTRVNNQIKNTKPGESSTVIPLKFSHLLTKISIGVVLNDEFATPPLPADYSMQISGTYAGSKVDFTKGEAKVVPGTDLSPITPTNETPGSDYDYLHKAIVVPQTVSKETNLFTVMIGTGPDKKIFQYKHPDDFIFEESTHYFFKLYVGRYKVTVDPEIIPWTETTPIEGTPIKIESIGGIPMQVENLTDGSTLIWTWTEAKGRCPLGYRLPTSTDINRLWPASVNVGFNKDDIIGTDYFCDATAKAIYGIKTDEKGAPYWIRWEYQGTGNDAKLKVSYWNSGGPTDFATVIDGANDQAEQYKRVRNAFPITKPEIMYFAATGGATAGTGTYWIDDKDDTMKTCSFSEAGFTLPTPHSGSSDSYSVRYIWNIH